MPRAYSLDLGERVVAAVVAGGTCVAVAATFAVSVASVVKWAQRYRATGSASAKPSGGDRRSERIQAHADFILAALDEQPDITLGELRTKMIEERGETFGTTTIWRFFDRRKITFKKSPHTPPSRNGLMS